MPVASINGQDMYYEIHGEGPQRSTLVVGILSVMADMAIWPGV